MARQEKDRKKIKDKENQRGDTAANPEVVEKGKKIKEDLSKLLDEIDDVLEENAEEFVKNYVQKGGE